MTLEQLSDQSNIPIVHLTSIENGRFSRFDDFYLKMYLKKYTQTLGVNLEQLYAYALQQPVPETETEPEAAISEESVDPNSMHHRVRTQAVSVETPARAQKNIKKIPATTPSPLSTLKPLPTKSKGNVGKFLIALFLVVLFVLFLVFIVDLFRNIGNHQTEQEAQPPALTLPDDLNLGEDDEDLNDDLSEEEQANEEAYVEVEPQPEDETRITLDDHIDRSQHFTVVTSREDIVLRMEHSGDNWIGGAINQMVGSGTFEETFELGDGDLLHLPMGAIHSLDALYLNDVAVDFYAEGIVGTQNLYFNIQFDAEVNQ